MARMMEKSVFITCMAVLGNMAHQSGFHRVPVHLWQKAHDSGNNPFTSGVNVDILLSQQVVVTGGEARRQT